MNDKKKSSDRPKTLRFGVSTGLKRVIGRELITDTEVAVFEIVKNSFDAGAKTVQLYFAEDRIAIVDDGRGMTYDDIVKKWLRVAYSSKRPENSMDDFRHKMADRKHYAGSKGIGRFSTDRLGHQLRLQSRHESESSSPVQFLRINWDKFEKDDREDFVNVPVEYEEHEDFDLPDDVEKVKHGTVVEILYPRAHWGREELLKLKSSLAKLINPFGAKSDNFRLFMLAPSERIEDEAEQGLFKEGEETEGQQPNTFPKLVNGIVQNFIFSGLKEKTTFIQVELTSDGKFLETKLIDRGELVYRIREPNPYPELEGSGFRSELYYLNHSAKVTFALRMGIPSVQFGSVFVFRNEFRVYPMGEEGDDWFGLDRRKQQGYSRFLGTREVIGRVDVFGDDENFKEASSRNQGLLETPAVAAMRRCFSYHVLRRLEKYVVPVNWADKADKHMEDLSRIKTDAGVSRVAEVVASLVDSKTIELLEFSPNLIRVLNEKSKDFEGSLSNLHTIASKAGDEELLKSIDRATKRFDELKKAEYAAIQKAEEEKQARLVAEKKVEKAEKEAAVFEQQLVEERKRNLFLTASADLDKTSLENFHHQIALYGGHINEYLSNQMQRFIDQDKIDKDDVFSLIETVSLLNQKIVSVAHFATKANFRLESEEIDEDLAAFIVDYSASLQEVYRVRKIAVAVTNECEAFQRKFKPMEVAIVIDNLVSNAKRARASKISLHLSEDQKGILSITAADNGRGLDSSITDPERIFERGFTKTHGSGLGLHHLRQVLGDMGGTIAVDASVKRGAKFIIKVGKNET